VATNIIEKIMKIVVLSDVEASTPLYEEKFTMVESKTTMTVNTSMKINELFLLRDKLV
jgi:hypothetical protein